MLRKVAVILLFFVFVSPCAASDLRVEGAKAYIFGFLGGDPGVYADSVFRDDALFVLRRMAYPLSTWSWAQAIIKDVSVEGGSAKVTVVKPDISSFFSGRRPYCTEEWAGYSSLFRSVEQGSVGQETKEVILKVSSLGEVETTEEVRKQMLETVLKDLSEALKWCRENKDVAPKEYVFSLRSEAEHGIVSLPSEAVKEIYETTKILEGDKR